MSYFPKGHHDTGDEVDDFDEYDPTPYGGGYDIALTYGRPIPPSEETCYPHDNSSDDFDYDRPQYTSYAEPCAYAEDALENEYKSYARPKPRPGPPAYGGPPPPRPSYGGENEYGSGAGSEYGNPEPEYGSGYGRKPEYGRPEPEYGSGYGRKPEYEEPGSEYGSGYGRRTEYEEPAPEYGRSEYGRKPDYERPNSEYVSGYGRRPEPESEEYGSGGYGRRPEGSEYEEEKPSYGYGRKPERSEYEEEEEEEQKPSYGRSEGYERPSYGRSEEEDYRKPSRDDDDEGYGRKKYVSFTFYLLLITMIL